MEDSERKDTVRPHASRAVSLVLAVKQDILVVESGARCPILYSFAKTLLDISYRYTNHQLKDESPVFGFGSLLKHVPRFYRRIPLFTLLPAVFTALPAVFPYRRIPRSECCGSIQDDLAAFAESSEL